MSGELLTLRQFLDTEWHPTEKIVDPWLPTSGISMLWGGRGGGKTFVTLGLALHVAAGWRFLEMPVPKARRVMYVDGEMAADELKGRLVKLEAGMGPFPPWTYENLAILTHEKFEHGIPDLSRPGAGRVLISKFAKAHQAELIILDNLSSLLQAGDENEAEAWMDFNKWLLNFRRQHITTLLIHHAGKQGTQRGTSKREDHLNSSVCIATTATEPNVAIDWKYTKWRSFQPKSFSLEIAFVKDGDLDISASIHKVEGMEDEVEEVRRMQEEEGLSQREIMKRTGLSKGTVQRRLEQSRTTKDA